LHVNHAMHAKAGACIRSIRELRARPWSGTGTTSKIASTTAARMATANAPSRGDFVLLVIELSGKAASWHDLAAEFVFVSSQQVQQLFTR
jgi:hypothetical protein